MDTKTFRLHEFLNPAEWRSLVVDASGGLSLGALPGLERFSEAVKPVLGLADGIVVSPGQARRLAGRSRSEAALLLRGDWTNALRGVDFVLPPETTALTPLLEPEDALDLGASALVIHFLLGYEEQIEAACLKTTVQLALQGSQAGLPLLVEVLPTGPRVVLLGKAIELGASYALEGGADGVVVPWPGTESFGNILQMAAEVPVWVMPTSLAAAVDEIGVALRMGAAGLWLDEGVFAMKAPDEFLGSLRARLHASQPSGE